MCVLTDLDKFFANSPFMTFLNGILTMVSYKRDL